MVEKKDEQILTRCGYRCDLCLAYRPNVERKDERKKLSDGWYTYYGFRVEPEDILCDGCMSGENPRLIDKNCPVRPCVIEKGFANCAYCKEYVCSKLKERIADYDEVRTKYGKEILQKDYEDFIRPFESKQRLDAIREKIKK